MSKLIDLTGQRFGRLTVIRRAETKGKNTMWLCQCDCGNQKNIQSAMLRRGDSRSCGCLQRELMSMRAKTHGMAKTRLYKEWRLMKERCYLETRDGYERYGGRGITVCQEWRESFEAFRDWALANGYRDDLTIDRIDVNGNYEPGNCRWITMNAQQNNKSTSRWITYDGKTQTLAQWAREKGLRRDTLRWRLESGWSIERALTEKSRYDK